MDENEDYDCVILGTGLTEGIVSGLLSVDGLRVLHIDKNSYYGGAASSLDLNQLFAKFRPGEPVKTSLGSSKEYLVDLIPKFIFSSGLLVQMILHCNVTHLLDFQSITGSYVYRDKKIHKVPANDGEALKSGLMGLFEKRRCQKFLSFIMEYDETDPKTEQGMKVKNITMKECFEKFGLEPNTIDFLGHAVALHSDDKYLTQPAYATIMKMKLYYDSLRRFDKAPSPYIYPLYGIGELPQSFARLSSVHGGTFRLNAPLAGFEYDDKGKVIGVKSTTGAVARCNFVVADPSYFPELVRSTGKIIRVICILNHPIDHVEESKSCQIIIPQKQVNRQNDIYVCMLSNSNAVCPKGKWLAIVATKVETNDPMSEVKPGLDLLGAIEERFVSISDTVEPINDGKENKIFISKSYDASTVFETTVEDVLDLYHRITGRELVMSEGKQSEQDK